MTINYYHKNIFIIILLYVTLIFGYYYVFQLFNYEGFHFEISFSKSVISSLIILLAIFATKNINSNFTYLLYVSVLIIYVIPVGVYYQFDKDAYFLQLFHVAIFSLFIYLTRNLKIKPIAKPFKLYSTKYANIILLIIICILILFFAKYIRYISLSNLLLENVYETRLVFRELQTGRSLTGYIFSPLARVLLPSLLIISLDRKNFAVTLFAVVLILYLYLTGSLKSILFGLFCVFLFYSGDAFQKIFRFVLILIVGIAFGIIVYQYYEYSIIIDAIVRRVFFIPSLLDTEYYTFFKNNFTYWSHNPLGNLFLDYEYDSVITMYIGENVFGDQGLNANVGIITEGYFSFGTIGVIVHLLIITFSFVLLKSLKISIKYFGIIFIYIYIMNTSLITQFYAGHGFLFLLIFSIYFLSSKHIKNDWDN